EVVLQDLREGDEERDQREEGGVGERRGPAGAFDLVELAGHLADEEEELDGEDAQLVPPVGLAAVEEDSGVGQPRPDNGARAREASLRPLVPLPAGLRDLGHGATIDARPGPTSVTPSVSEGPGRVGDS